MFITIFGIGYLIMTVFATIIFYSACVIGARADERAAAWRKGDPTLEELEAPFTFDPRTLAEKAIG